MKGAIIGDVVGSVYEFNPTQNPTFPLLSEDSTFTDDTICTIAIADAFLHEKNYAEKLKYWCRKYPNPMGSYGNAFYSWIYNDDVKFTNNSCGNGALMRISPICLADIPVTDALLQCSKATICSHNHPEALDAVIAYMQILRGLRKYKDKKIIHPIMNDAYGRKWRHYLPHTGVFIDTCVDTLRLATHLFLLSTSFEDAIRLAVLQGGDADTLAAIIGGMAEAYYGVDEKLWEMVKPRLPGEFIEVVNQYYDIMGNL